MWLLTGHLICICESIKMVDTQYILWIWANSMFFAYNSRFMAQLLNKQWHIKHNVKRNRYKYSCAYRQEAVNTALQNTKLYNKTQTSFPTILENNKKWYDFSSLYLFISFSLLFYYCISWPSNMVTTSHTNSIFLRPESMDVFEFF